MNRYVKYVISLGFSGVTLDNHQKNDPKRYRVLRYETLDFRQARHVLGRSKRHERDRFVYVLRSTHGLRVDTKRRIIVLGNGKKAVSALLRTIPSKE